MEHYGIIKEQKWVERYEWKNITFNKYLVKFKDGDNFYVINRSEKIEQALIGSHLIYNLKNDNEIGKHKIVGYEVKNEEKYYLVSRSDLKEIMAYAIEKQNEINERPN
jgi:hypothetical protein